MKSTTASSKEPSQFGWPLFAFFATANGIVALAGILIALFDRSMSGPIFIGLYALGILSPFVASLIYLKLATGTIAGLKRMYLPLKLGKGAWMIPAVPLSIGIAYAMAGFAGVPVEWSHLPPLTSWLIGIAGWSSIMWAEETAWRGTLLPLLQTRYGPMRATLWVSLAWIVWHIPLLHLLGFGVEQWILFSFQLLGLSAVMTWAHNRSGTTVVAVLIHGFGNATSQYLISTVPSMTELEALRIQAVGPAVLGLLVVLATKGRLGQKPILPDQKFSTAALPLCRQTP